MSEDPTTNEEQAVEEHSAEEQEETVTEATVTEEAPADEAPEQPVATEAEEAPAEEADTEEPAEQPVASEEAAEETSTEDAETEEVNEPVASANGTGTINDLSTGMKLEGKVKAIQIYGAFVDIGIGQDALLHISQLGQSNVRNVEDVVKVGETITVYVLKIDTDANRVALSMEPTPSVTWDDLKQGQKVNGTVVRIENFGVFVDVGAERPGMVHVSELADGYVKTPSDVVSVGQEVEVRILKVNRKKRQIDLTMKEQQEDYSAELLEDQEELPTAMEMAFRRAQRAMDGDGGASGGDNSKKQSERKKREQEDIIARTLRGHSNN